MIGIGEDGICMSNANSSGKSTTDRRRCKRIGTSSLMSYVYMDEEGNEIAGGIGMSLNLSLEGLLLEAYLPVESPYILIIFIGSEGQLVDIKGEIVHSRPGASRHFLVGIQFADSHERPKRSKRMKVQCPNCGAAYQIAESKTPVKGAYAGCLKCQARFFVCTDRRCGRDRRSGRNRQKACHSVEEDFPYFLKGGTERRNWLERRSRGERGSDWPRVSKRYISGGGLISRSL